MKTHTSQFKNNIKQFGRELDSKITYTINGVTTELGAEQLNSVSPHYEGAVLKSVMKQLDIDSNVEIPVGTILTYQFGVKTGSGYEYINYGNYVVKEVEKQEDTHSWKITCYDKMLYAMKDYERPVGKNLFDAYIQAGNYGSATYTVANDGLITQSASDSSNWTTYTNRYFVLEAGTYTISVIGKDSNTNLQLRNITDSADIVTTKNNNYTFTLSTQKTLALKTWGGTYPQSYYIQIEKGNTVTSYLPFFTYPITLKNYLLSLCYDLEIDVVNTNFANYNREIQSELFLDADGNSIGYTYRDVLDEIAQATGSTICINDEDKLEIRYINQTVGKNLFDLDEFLKTANKSSATTFTKITNGFTMSFTAGTDAIIGGVVSQNATLGATYRNGVIKVKPNTTYTIHLNNSPKCYVSFLNSSYVGTQSYYKFTVDYIGPTNYTFTTDANTTYLYLRFGIQNNNYTSWTFQNIQVEEGNTATTYEPYGDTIDEEYLKDVNVNFGEKYGPVNTIVLSRSAGADKVSLSQPSNLADDQKYAIEISDNQIMNGNDRADYLPDLLSKLYGLEYYINDFTSTGICYYDLCDKYNVKVDNKFYSCIMFNDNAEITQGLKEDIYTDMPEEAEEDYKYIGDDDRKVTQAYIIADKTRGEIVAVTNKIDETNGRINSVETRQTATERTIEVKTQNIDADGNITEVTTTNGFTFNAQGLDIHTSDNAFHTTIDEDSTEYKDGDTVVSTTSKDGSALRQLRMLEQNYYSYNASNTSDIMDTSNYDFVDERVEDSGDYVYATFYNGED